jgi:hypothetical protein
MRSLVTSTLVQSFSWYIVSKWRLFQNFNFEVTGFACPATYKNCSFAVLRTRPQGEKLQEPVPKQPILEFQNNRFWNRLNPYWTCSIISVIKQLPLEHCNFAAARQEMAKPDRPPTGLLNKPAAFLRLFRLRRPLQPPDSPPIVKTNIIA